MSNPCPGAAFYGSHRDSESADDEHRCWDRCADSAFWTESIWLHLGPRPRERLERGRGALSRNKEQITKKQKSLPKRVFGTSRPAQRYLATRTDAAERTQVLLLLDKDAGECEVEIEAFRKLLVVLESHLSKALAARGVTDAQAEAARRMGATREFVRG